MLWFIYVKHHEACSPLNKEWDQVQDKECYDGKQVACVVPTRVRSGWTMDWVGNGLAAPTNS